MFLPPHRVWVVILALLSSGWIGVTTYWVSHPIDLEISQYTSGHQHRSTNDTTEEESADEAIARYTLGLMVFTAILAVATIDLVIATASQLYLGRAEFIATHRPKIKIHVIEVTRREVNHQTFIGASILAFNVGESVAKNVEVRGEIFMGPRFAIDVQRPLVKRFDEVLSGQKLRAEITSEWQTSYAAAVRRTGIVCYCLGWIAYWDGNDQRRETAFCLQPEFEVQGDRWVSAKKPEYEYEY